MATVRDLLDTLLPSATIVVAPGEARGLTEVGWVRVLKARVPAFDALESGDVAIIPPAALVSVAPERTDRDALADGLGRARPALLVLLTPETADEIAAVDGLADRARAIDLPAVRVGGRDPVGLERSIIGFLVNRRAELESEATRIETDVERLALRGAGLDELVGAIAAAFGRPVALEGGRGDRLAVHAPAEHAGAAAEASAYLRRRGTVALRVRLPAQPIPSDAGAPDDQTGDSSASAGSASAGSLVLLGGRPVTELEELASERLAGLLALQISRDTAVRRARETARRAEKMPSDGPPWVSILARQALPSTAPAGDRPDRSSEAVRADLRILAPARRMGLRGDAFSLELRLIAAAPPDDPGGIVLAGRVARYLGRSVAVSSPFGAPAERSVAEAAARATLEAIERLGRPPMVALATRLPAYRLLAGLHNLPDGPNQARLLLDPLLSARPAIRAELLETLRAVLTSDGAADAALALGVHRNTIAHRVRRIEQLGDWDLSDGDLRLALAVALRIEEVQG